MALTDEVTTRYSNARLVQLTNPDAARGSTSVDTTRLAAAATDAEAEFALLAGTAYDGSVASHVAAGVLGVIWKLETYAGPSGASTDRSWQAFFDACERVALTAGRNRAWPTGTGTLDPSNEVANSRPDQDRLRWDDVTLRPPGGYADDV